MRAVSEVVAAVALMLVALFAASMVVLAFTPRIRLVSLETVDAYQSVRINSTHAVCYALTDIEVKYLRDMGISVWIFEDINGDGWNETVPIFNGTIPAGSYYVVSPPICG